jgi:hypothetical protein
LRAGETDDAGGGCDTVSAGTKIWFRQGKTDADLVPVNPPKGSVRGTNLKSVPPLKKENNIKRGNKETQ